MNAARHRTRADERGFTVIEVLVAMVLLTVGTLTLLGGLISSGTLTLGSQVHEAAIGFAEQQIETLRQQPFAALALSGAPSPSPTVNDPNFYTQPATVSQPTGCYQIQLNYQTGGTPSPICESFVTGGTITSGPQMITGYPGLSGTYDVYVTSHLEAPLNTPASNGCLTISATVVCLNGSEKRITVAVLPSSPSGARKAVWVTSIVTDPNTTPLSLP